MTSLLTLCEDYLAFRRSLGAKLTMTHGLLLQFIAFLAQREAPFITAALALEWASKPQGVQQQWRARRLSEVRQFARYVHALDPRHEVPPLHDRSETCNVGGISVQVASIPDLIFLKRLADRPRDRDDIEKLETIARLKGKRDEPHEDT